MRPVFMQTDHWISSVKCLAKYCCRLVPWKQCTLPHQNYSNRKKTKKQNKKKDKGTYRYIPINGFFLMSSTTNVVLVWRASSNDLAPSLDIPHCCKSSAKIFGEVKQIIKWHNL